MQARRFTRARSAIVIASVAAEHGTRCGPTKPSSMPTSTPAWPTHAHDTARRLLMRETRTRRLVPVSRSRPLRLSGAIRVHPLLVVCAE
jgi:hypothetical protein